MTIEDPVQGTRPGSTGGDAAAETSALDPAELRQIAVLGQDVVCVAGLDRVLRWVSPSVTRVLGWTPEELVGTVFADLLHPEDRAQSAKLRSGVYSGDPVAAHQASQAAARVRRADGSYRWMSADVAVLRDDAGEPVGAALAWTDMDDLIRARQVAEGVELPVDATLFSFLDPRVRIEAVRDETGTIVDFVITDANAAAWMALRKQRAAVVGSRLNEAFPHLRDSGVFAAYASAVETGAQIEERGSPSGAQGTVAGGFYDLRAVPAGDGLTVTWRDVTERVRRETTLTRLEQRYLLMAEGTSEVVVAGNNDGVIEWVSDSVTDLLGWTPEQVEGTRFVDLVHPGDRSAVAGTQRTVLGGDEASVTVRLAHADLGWRWVSALVRPMLDESGRIVGRMGSWHDAEEEVSTREALRHYRQRFQLLADHTTDLVVRTTDGGLVRWISPSVEEQLGWSAEATVGRPLCDLVHPDDRGACVWDRSPAAAGDTAISDEPAVVRVSHRDGGHRFMSLAMSSALAEDGTVDGTVVTLRDVDALVRAQQAAQADRDRAAATADTILDPHMILIAVRDDDGAIVDFRLSELNDEAVRYIGLERDVVVGQCVGAHMPPTTVEILKEALGRVIATGEPLSVEDLRYEDVARRIRRVVDLRAVKLGDGASCTWRDNTERHRLEQTLAAHAHRDEVTGLANRARVVERIAEGVQAAAGTDRHLGVLMLDLDRFKLVNDSRGHAVGDDLLRATAHRLSSLVRTGDLVGRVGGDEFAVVMADLADPEELTAAARRIVSGFRVPLSHDGDQFAITVSIGIAVADGESSPEDLLREADTAMYRAKEEGRDRVSRYSDDLRDRAVELLAIEAGLRPALGHHEFELYYQPEVELATGAVVAVEALIRWHHPSGELYAADRFIEIAEQSGLIVDIGEWVIGEACRQAADWARRRPEHRITTRVNLSVGQLTEPGLLDVVERAIDSTGVDPTRLCVEITETALMRETDTVRANLVALAERGIEVAIDDFGTGYASLAYLRDFPIHVIKIDRSFTTLMVNDDYERRLIAGVIALAQLLEMRVTAEGIEVAEQAHLLAGLGCNGGQGYLYSKAVPADEVEALFDRRFD